MKPIVTAALCASILAGCASSPDRISAAYVSPIQYSGYDCDQVRSELMRVAGRVREVAGAQKQQANSDAIAMASALSSSGPPFSSWLAAMTARRNYLA